MNRLKYLRTEKGESLEKIAQYLNVTIQTISNYENEKRDMSPDTIIKLSDYFGVSTDYLLGKSNIRNIESITIDMDEVDIACSNGIRGLNETNKMIVKNTIEALRLKQEKDEEGEK